MNVLQITSSSNGKTFNVRLLREGDRYGLDDCLTHDKDGELVEFWDDQYKHDPDLGQFVSRYYASTLLGQDQWSDSIEGRGLCLDGGYADVWSIDAAAATEVCEWLKKELENES